jgi:MSHA biogenesis protein MshQ
MGAMRGWLFVVMLAACKYSGPTDPNAPGDGSTGDPDMQVVDPDAPDAAPPTVWLQPYAHRKRITLLEAMIDDSGGALDNFPVLISLDDADLGAATSAPDMAFTTDDALTLLDSEIERFSGNELVAWVRIPALSATANTALYLYYGNATPPNTNPQGVWSGQYQAVWHLEQGGADATAGNHDGTTSGATAATGKLGRGLSFDGNDFVDFNTMDVGNAFTISAWVNLGTNAAGIRTLMSNTIVGGNQDGFRFFVNTSGTADRRVLFETGNGGGQENCQTGTNVVTMGTFARIDAVIDRAQGSCAIFINGVNNTDPANNDVLTNFETNLDFEIGRMKNGVEWTGSLDEVTVASTKRPLGWITTTFNNQNAPGAFYTVGGEEDRPD